MIQYLQTYTCTVGDIKVSAPILKVHMIRGRHCTSHIQAPYFNYCKTGNFGQQ